MVFIGTSVNFGFHQNAEVTGGALGQIKKKKDLLQTDHFPIPT